MRAAFLVYDYFPKDMILPLLFGDSKIEIDIEQSRFEVLAPSIEAPSLSDADIGILIDSPINSQQLELIVEPGETVLIVVPDATRSAGSAQIVNLLVRRLIAAGIMAYDIGIIFATGIHRRVTLEEKALILTPFIAQRIRTFDHDPFDLAALINLGTTSRGIPIELNRKLKEFDRVISIGGISFHYFAGFTGGRKAICPGLASSRTISESHKLAFDCKTTTRAIGVAPGKLAGNPVNDSFIEICEFAAPDFSINTFVNSLGEITELFAGNWKSSHETACAKFAEQNTISISEKRQLVVVSCGGKPYDLNLIQAHKALDTAAAACADGGTIVLIAECEEGLGRADFLHWFKAGNSNELATNLCEKYAVNGQTAWSFLEKAERFNVKMFTSLSRDFTKQLRIEKIDSIQEFVDSNKASTAFVIQNGSKILIRNS